MINSYNGYIYLLLSIVSACICNTIKLSDGFTKLIPGIIALIFTIILTILLGITYTKMELNILSYICQCYIIYMYIWYCCL